VVRGLFQRTFLIFQDIAKIQSGDLSSPRSHPLASPLMGSLTTKVRWARSHLGLESAEFVTRWAGCNTGQDRAGLAVLTAWTLYGAQRRTSGQGMRVGHIRHSLDQAVHNMLSGHRPPIG